MNYHWPTQKNYLRFHLFWALAAGLGLCTPLLASEFPTKVVCEGKYSGHLQGICLDDEGHIYWSFTTWLVKTDRHGKLIKKVPAVSHHGDLCYADGKVYVAVNLGEFNNPKGNADSWVYIYNANNLKEVARHEVQEVEYGAGGIATTDGRFIVVGGLPDEIDENYLYEYSNEFNLVKKWTLPSGHTHLGIQGTTFSDGEWWFACYGSQVLRATANFEMKGRTTFECGYGIVRLGNDQFYIARGNYEKQSGHDGYLLRAIPDEKTGLKVSNPKSSGGPILNHEVETQPTKETLFIAKPLTEAGTFTEGIEGPACDRAGHIFAVNFAQQQTIGRVTPQGVGTVFLTLANGSVGNGIRIDPQGTMFVADYVNHNILRVDPKTRKVDVLAHSDAMNQPNDLAMAADGTLYVSDPNWKDGTGQLWRIDRDGKLTRLAHNLGTTNGIEVSPDGKTLYVNESVQRKVWAYPLSARGELGERRLVKSFSSHSLDGMRCDAAGDLYVTRHGAGVVVKLSPTGNVLREIDVLGSMPSNICFGGPDGRTAYVTEVEHRRLIQFRVDSPGLTWQRFKRRPVR